MGSPVEVGCGIMYTILSDLRENEGYLGQESLLHNIKKGESYIASTLHGFICMSFIMSAVMTSLSIICIRGGLVGVA